MAPQRDRAPPDVSDYLEMQDKLAKAEERARGLEARVSELQSLLEESEVSCVATPFYMLKVNMCPVPAASRIACCLANRCAQRPLS